MRIQKELLKVYDLKSVNKIKSSGKSHAHKIQSWQRAKEMGRNLRRFIVHTLTQ